MTWGGFSTVSPSPYMSAGRGSKLKAIAFLNFRPITRGIYREFSLTNIHNFPALQPPRVSYNRSHQYPFQDFTFSEYLVDRVTQSLSNYLQLISR
ncbi:hypothetical protein SPLC1_S051880 [Arthrospira platensis C1]|nr:hypothetical protein SPLC1_S051880 [Arthrospira platensis C1]